ncbi:hypothetical protein CgunFtcFv8_018113 [Champsocephalus gunnari]|uniref:Protein MGARP N-terminal domain-containing protein n=1 Tax=Champsocephalus gunnari TaxID=52237 RepID=A0AAN8DLU3_CHAGU|nr:hypothetical protein CgunFtcFv8_018113 [Champsocephalus gunnari]
MFSCRAAWQRCGPLARKAAYRLPRDVVQRRQMSSMPGGSAENILYSLLCGGALVASVSYAYSTVSSDGNRFNDRISEIQARPKTEWVPKPWPPKTGEEEEEEEEAAAAEEEEEAAGEEEEAAGEAEVGAEEAAGEAEVGAEEAADGEVENVAEAVAEVVAEVAEVVAEVAEVVAEVAEVVAEVAEEVAEVAEEVETVAEEVAHAAEAVEEAAEAGAEPAAAEESDSNVPLAAASALEAPEITEDKEPLPSVEEAPAPVEEAPAPVEEAPAPVEREYIVVVLEGAPKAEKRPRVLGVSSMTGRVIAAPEEDHAPAE